MSENEIAEIRAAWAALRARINREMEAKFAVESAHLQNRMEETLYALYREGYSISRLCRLYGTKNWQTVKDYIVAAQARHDAQEEAVREAGLALGKTFVINTLGSGVFEIITTNWTPLNDDTVSPFTGKIAVKIKPDLKAVIPVAVHAGVEYDVGTDLHKELADWRKNRGSEVVQNLLALSGLDKD